MLELCQHVCLVRYPFSCLSGVLFFFLTEINSTSISIRACEIIMWVRSGNYGCFVTWFCYKLIAKPGNKTATVSWPDPYPRKTVGFNNSSLPLTSRLLGTTTLEALTWICNQNTLNYRCNSLFMSYSQWVLREFTFTGTHTFVSG